MTATLVTNIINNIFHVVWFYNLVLEPKNRPGKRAVISVLTGIFFQILMIFIYSGRTLDTITYLLSYIFAAFVFGGMFCFGLSASSLPKSMFLISAYYCLWTFIYGFISIVTGSYAGAGNQAIWGLRIFLNLFFLLLYQVFLKKKLVCIYREMKSGYEIITVISCLTFVMMTFLLFYNQSRKEQELSHIFLMCFAYVFMVIVYVLLFYFMVQADQKQQIKQMQFHEKLLMSQIDSYEKIEQNARQMRHDFRHHNMVVMDLASQKDYEGILSYLGEYERLEEENVCKKFSSNHAVDSLISVYMARAGQNGIEFKADIQMRETSGISDVDLVSVLANMLENAVKGCMESEGIRRMEIKVLQKHTMLLIVCRNTCGADILFQNGLPRARDHEGIGAESILNTVKKYAGDVDFSVENGVFVCRALLNGKNA